LYYVSSRTDHECIINIFIYIIIWRVSWVFSIFSFFWFLFSWFSKYNS